MPNVYSSPKIAREMVRRFGKKAQTVRVEMKYTREVGNFIRSVESAHKNTEKSTRVFS